MCKCVNSGNTPITSLRIHYIPEVILNDSSKTEEHIYETEVYFNTLNIFKLQALTFNGKTCAFECVKGQYIATFDLEPGDVVDLSVLIFATNQR